MKHFDCSISLSRWCPIFHRRLGVSCNGLSLCTGPTWFLGCRARRWYVLVRSSATRATVVRRTRTVRTATTRSTRSVVGLWRGNVPRSFCCSLSSRSSPFSPISSVHPDIYTALSQ